ncbi:hypothetical protein BROUX41_001325 [Berkeleyomyces rouxiae]|uniref:uncharacterized protein n=1 Tax=Berkeleyomyces rouxiae TaxID=2035830 RepID=UPI003B7F5CDB
MAVTYTPVVPDRGPQVFSAALATIIMATVFIAARTYCRIFIIRNFTIDDRVLLVSWVLAVGLSCDIMIGASSGIGRHDRDITHEKISPIRKAEYSFTVLYNACLATTKTSILMFYLRLSKNTNTFLRFSSWLVMAIVNIAAIVLTFMNIFQCTPMNASWKPIKEGDKCIPLLKQLLCAAPVNVITDLAILLLPIPVLTGMKLPFRQKAILVGTFVFGIFITVIDVVRIYFLQKAYNTSPMDEGVQGLFGQQVDLMWYLAPALMWSTVEVNLGIVWACIPTLKPLIIRIIPRLVVGPHFNSKSSVSGSRGQERSPPNNQSSTSDSSATIQVPSPVAISSVGRSREMSMIDFLVDNEDINDGDVSSVYERRARNSNFTTMPSITEIPTMTSTLHDPRLIGGGGQNTYIDFVDMSDPRSLLNCSPKQSWKYCSSVALLFFLWGSTYGILSSLNNAVALAGGISTAQTISLSVAYFGGGYILGPLLVGGWILRRDEHQRLRHRHQRDTDHIGGFKISFMVGLGIYGIGTMIFWPSSVLNSYSGFMLSNFVVGFGLATLETSANTYMILCGPDDYAEMRLMLAQAFQATGSLIMNVMAKKIFFRNLTKDNSNNPKILVNVQWTYFAITLICAFLIIFFYYISVPEVTDHELKEVAKRSPVRPDKKSWFGYELRTICIVFAVLSQWTYCAFQGCMRNYNSALLVSIYPNTPQRGPEAIIIASSLSNLKLPGYGMTITEAYYISQSTFALGRFVTAFVLYLAVKRPWMPRPRILLLITTTCTVILCTISSLYQPSELGLLNIPVALCYFFMGPIWPLIFSIALRHQGERTKQVAAYITVGASGPAAWLFVQYGIIKGGSTVNASFFLLVGLQCITLLYPLVLNFLKDAKLLSDPVRYHTTAADDEKMAHSRRSSARKRSIPITLNIESSIEVPVNVLDHALLHTSQSSQLQANTTFPTATGT